ncbi:MAG: transposase [Thermodesulfobacteriota bacterium]
MRTRYRIIEDSHPYFLTCTIIEWLPVFTRKPYFEIIIDSLKYCRERKGLKIFAYVVLDNHLHLVAHGERLPETIKEFKSFTAQGIIKLATEEGKDWLLNQFKFFKARHKQESRHQVWQEGFHPQLVISEEMLSQKVEYIHDNPVKAGLVERAEDWLYSSAKNYLGQAGMLEIDVLEV